MYSSVCCTNRTLRTFFFLYAAAVVAAAADYYYFYFVGWLVVRIGCMWRVEYIHQTKICIYIHIYTTYIPTFTFTFHTQRIKHTYIPIPKYRE